MKIPSNASYMGHWPLKYSAVLADGPTLYVMYQSATAIAVRLATGFTIGKNLTGQKLVNGTKGTQLTRSTIHLNRLFVRHEDGKPACSKIGTPPLAETQHACLQFRETGHGQQRPLACLNPDTNIFYHHLARV
jgi:hypothetical protein